MRDFKIWGYAFVSQNKAGEWYARDEKFGSGLHVVAPTLAQALSCLQVELYELGHRKQHPLPLDILESLLKCKYPHLVGEE